MCKNKALKRIFTPGERKEEESGTNGVISTCIVY
jgi:hypothetical protein